jgi:hypothetical protein
MRGFARTALSGFGLLAYGLVFAELFLRLMDPQPIIPRYVTGTPLGIRGNIPHAVYRQRTPETEVEIRINGQGLRADRDFPLAKPAGTCRVALMGDSYFLGFENDLAESIAGRLEAELAAAGYRAEVLNFAVSGFGTAEMILAFEGRARAFAPDIAVFQFHASDFADNIRTAALLAADPAAGFRPTGASYLPGIAIQDRLMQFAPYRWAIGHSHLYTAVRERTALLVKDLLVTLRRAAALAAAPPPADPGGEAGDPADRDRAGPARLTGRLLAHAGRLAAAAGSDAYILDIPTVIDRTHFVSRADLLGLDPATAARLVPLLPALEAAAGPETRLFFERGHRHMTPLGNAIAARILAARILAGSAPRLAACRG